MPINCPLTLRTIKGSKLTFNELDGNFLNLRNCIYQLENQISTQDTYVTGGTYSSGTTSLDFVGNAGFTPFSVDVSALTGGTSGPDTNFANTDLIFDANRTHDTNNNDLFVYDSSGLDNTGPYLYHNTSQDYISIGHGSREYLDIGEITGVSGFTFFTNTLRRMTLNEEGNLGINRLPEFRLDVAGETRMSGISQNVLTVIGSGDTEPLFTVQGSSGELFSITDSLVGSLFAVNDISGLPILEVFDDNTVHMGSYQAPSLNTTVKLNPGTGLSTVYSLPISAYTGAFFDYTVSNTTGARAGNISSIWSGTTVEFNEVPTNDIGSTTPITFTMSSDGSNASLQVSATTTGWEVKTIVRSI